MSVARRLHPAEGELHLGPDGRGVHVDDAELELVDGGEGGADVPGVDGAREAVLRGVGGRYRLLEVGGGDDARHRPEDLLPGDAHAGGHAVEHGGLDEVAPLVAGPR